MSGTAGFATSFWSADYAAGLGVLFGKLQQGVQENQQVLTLARLRADAEDLYGQKLSEIAPATDRITGGFSRDDGASVRKAYEGVRSEMETASQSHRKIASNIRELVVNPFSRWCEAHALRVQNSQDDLQGRIKLHDKQAEQVRKLRSQYYNKCRLVEDLEEEDKLAFQDPSSQVPGTPKPQPVPTVKVEEPEPDEPEYIELGDETYGPEQVKRILTHMLENIKLGETKYPILGTYQNTSSGAEITDYIQQHLKASSVSYAERIGQDMVTHGFLRLIGNLGGEFANSTKMKYQWRPRVFQITGVPEKKQQLNRVMSLGTEGLDSPVGGVSDYLAGWNPLNNPYPNETPSEKLRREGRESDERYKASVRKLDALRCNLEEAMIDHLKFMERCELDRLKAIKSVILDFSGAIGNVIPSLQSTVDSMMLFQETVQPLGDVRYLLENYRTGSFFPKVQTYENYYNSVDEQTFGVDLEARARSDRKRVPAIITTVLTFLDNHYPDLEGDEARRGIWLVDVPLAATHHLRSQINTGKAPPVDALEKYEIPIVASVLKLYLLELPDSLVSSHVYEIIKTIYTTTGPTASDEARISVLQNTLGQLRLANIATLDALTTHFTRLIDLTSADEVYIAALANALAPCFLRPKTETSLTMAEKFNYRLVRDLFAHKEAIFGELKRASLQHSSSGASARPRAISTDESNRRANMEERQRAIANRSRASSPAPSPRQATSVHRRERSIGGPETRFPIQTSPTDARRQTRNSLEVPGSLENSPVVQAPAAGSDSAIPSKPAPSNGQTGAGAGFSYGNGPGDTIESPSDSGTPTSVGAEVDKRNSVGRRYPRKPAGGLQRNLVEDRPVGVELVDRPMDD